MKLRFWRRRRRRSQQTALPPASGPILGPGPGALIAPPSLPPPMILIDRDKLKVESVHYIGHDRILIRGNYDGFPIKAEGWYSNLVAHVGSYGGAVDHEPRHATDEERDEYYTDLLAETYEKLRLATGIKLR